MRAESTGRVSVSGGGHAESRHRPLRMLRTMETGLSARLRRGTRGPLCGNRPSRRLDEFAVPIGLGPQSAGRTPVPSPVALSAACNTKKASSGTKFLVAALVISAALACIAPAKAQTYDTYVGNLGQGNTNKSIFLLSVATRFTTGAHSDGYPLTAVEIALPDDISLIGRGFPLSVCTVDDDGFPTSTCWEFSWPTTFGPGTAVFTAPANTQLAANTTYTVLTQV